ncbi:MAG: WYL domain-containing protein [Comamonas sp.]|jgi:predicted DNA-binding transcriptional regulator YafY|uniref:helix-turn-helix transcriptional regulator n=1 Tax=Comamonas sp. TaxID=34028 RepID=UPI00282CE061|nr:WYL domain-containing protein [Comamonas sp.]MDR0217203.1 WYL domain-containing protein [Comamonas sp.]
MPSKTTRHDSTKGEHLAQRLSHILARLHQGGIIDKHQLAREFGVNLRTIERDLGERLQGIAERGPNGQWKLTHTAQGSIPTTYLDSYAHLTGTEGLFPDNSQAYLLQQLDTPRKYLATHVQAVPYEDLGSHGQAFAMLQSAIQKHHLCGFTYKNKSRSVHPYRLLHKNGIWYLSAEEAGKLKNFSVALIETLTVDESACFIPKKAHAEYINDKDDVWFTAETTEVLLRVAPEVAHYFARRQLLPRQQHRANSDGSLLVTTQINHINQLLPVVRYWLPNVRIVKPMEWHEELIRGLQQALDKWDVSAMETSP